MKECPVCGEVLKQKPCEKDSSFRKRVYCGRECASSANIYKRWNRCVPLVILCFFLSGCAYGMYDQPSGLFWVDQPFTQKMAQQNAQMWNQYYQNQQLWQMQQLNNTLRMMPTHGY